jgi:nicotinate-nucleotide--dimethylbenzimidazole phosphoribosyltransferase
VSDVLDHILQSISPASVAQATGAAQRLLRAQLGDEHNGLSEVATRLCAARHAPAPTLQRKTVVVVAADHGVASPGIDLGENNPTLVGLRLMAEGGAAINSAVRSAGAQLVLVDAGIRGGAQIDMGRGVLSFRTGNGTANFTVEPAMSRDDALAALQTGIALVFSLADAGLDMLALGQLAAGSQPCSAAVVAALTGTAPAALSAADSDVVIPALALHDLAGPQAVLAAPVDVLAKVGGFDIGVMAGMILGAASISVPVVLDGHGTSAAALIAQRLCEHVRGYVFASHAGGISAHSRALAALRLEPLFAVGLAQGEGTGAVLAMPMFDAALRVLAESELRD